MTTNNKISSLDAFVYCWTDHLTNRLYIGSHKGSTTDGYVCSSKVMMEQYNKRPHDFTRQIVAEGQWSDIRRLEARLLITVNARDDDQFYNQSNGNDKFYCKEKTAEHREKISKTLTGKKIGPRSEQTKQKMRKPKSAEHKMKFVGNQNATGHVKSPEAIEKTRQANLGRKNSPEAIANLKIGANKGWATRRMNNVNK